MKHLSILLVSGLWLTGIAYPQNPPTFGAMDTVRIIAGSGTNQVLIPKVTDGDSTIVQDIVFTATSSDTMLISVISFSYKAGDNMAVMTVRDKGVKGQTSIHINATDADGTVSHDVPVIIGTYHNPGVKMSFYDIVFWQNAVPDESIASVFDTIIQQFDAPFDAVNYDPIPLTVGPAMGGPKNKYFTATVRGYLVPPITGDYKFTLHGVEPSDLYLSPNANMGSKALLLHDSWDVSPDPTSNAVYMESGKVYAIYAVQHVIESRGLSVEWMGPGISQQIIQGQYIMPSYDGIAPSAPQNLHTVVKAVKDLILGWNASSDNNKIAGYNVYVDGLKVNPAPIPEISYKLSGLNAKSAHTIVVLAIDMAGNKSLISNILNDTTYAEDGIPPTPPDTMSTILATGQAVRITWSGATDAETQVIGYNVYVNDNLYNTAGPLYTDTLIIRGLTPVTTYNIQIEAYDAGYNLSVKSDTFHTSTAVFNPLGPDLGEKRGRLKIFMNNISWNEGIGLNGPYEDGSMVNNPTIRKLVKDFRPGSIRWGGLSANVFSLSGSSGTGKNNTYAKMLSLANEIGCYFALTVGVQDGIDYRTNSNTFFNLLEYLAGPADKTWGMRRSAEGYTDPLLQKSRGLLIEFGNEVWGAAAHNAQIGSDYAKYGQWCRDMARVIRSSPYYDSTRITMVYSGRNPHPDDSYGLTQSEFTGDTGEVECLSVSGYLGGNMNYDPNLPMGTSELEYYLNRFGQVARNVDGFVASMKTMLTLTGTIKSFYLYESNATTASYNGRLGQAILMTDYFATSMNYGSIVPAIFHLTGGEWRITRSEENYKPLSLYITGKYFNTYCKGNVLQTQFESTNKINNGYPSKIPFDPVGGHAYCKDSSYSILLCSRDFENDYTVQIDLPDDFTFQPKATKYVFTGDNFSSFDVAVDSSEIDFADSLFVTVPKYGMVLINFTGQNRHFDPRPIGYFDRIRPEKITIIPETDTILIYNNGKIYFKANVEPSNAFSTAYIMKPFQNPVNAVLLSWGQKYQLKGSGQCDGNGNVILIAYPADNHSVTDLQTVVITNQGLNCGTGIEEKQAGNRDLIYPNPARDKLYIGVSKGALPVVTVFDLTGRMLIKDKPAKGNEIDISPLQPGMYIIKIQTTEETRSERFLKK